MPAPFVGRGSKLQLEIVSVFTDIAWVESIEGPDASVGTVETLHLLSTTKTRLPTIGDWGDVPATILYDPAETTHAALTSLIAAPAVRNWKILYSNVDTSVYTFAAILTKFKPTGIEVEGLVRAEIVLSISGDVTITV